MNQTEKMPSLGGFVTSYKDFIGKQRKIDPHGIFSEQIFGPVTSYKCACGNFNSEVLHNGQICPKCGVLCASNNLRYTTFGKIRLIFPVIKLNVRDNFLKIIGYNNKIILDPKRTDYLNSDTRYLAIKGDKSEIKIFKDLTQKPGYLTIPFRITGIFSLYLVLKFLAEKIHVPIAIEIFNKNYMSHVIDILPPDLRLVSYDDTKKEVRTPEINKHYTSILRMNSLNKHIMTNIQVDIQDWISRITMNLKDGILDQDIIEPTVIEYDQKAAMYQYYIDCIYQSVYDEISGKEGLIRSSILGKNIEFSARTVICCDPSLRPYEVRVSKIILKKLWMPYFLHYITTVKNLDYDYSYDSFILHEDKNPEFDRLFNEFLKWFCNNDLWERGDGHTTVLKMLSQIAYINRQPTLWRHGIPAVRLIPSEDDNDFTIGVSPPMLEAMNGDFDGDSIIGDICIYIGPQHRQILCNIKDFNKYVNTSFKKSYTRDDGVKITKYHVLDEVYIKAIDKDCNIGMKKITEWSIHDNLELFTVQLKNRVANSHQFEPIIMSEKHSLVVFDRNTKQIIKICISDLQKEPSRFFLVKDKCLNSKFIDPKFDYSNEFGWLIGSWLGDGSITGGSVATFSLSNSDYNLLDKGKLLLEKLFPNDNVWTNETGHNENSFSTYFDCEPADHVRVTNHPFTDFLKHYFGKNANGKILPNNILQFSNEFIIGLLAGYIDSDGTINETNINFTSCSKQLLERLKYCLQIKFNVKCSKIYSYEKNIIDSKGDKTDKLNTYNMLHLTITRDTVGFFQKVIQNMTITHKIDNIKNLITKALSKRELEIHYIPKGKINKRQFQNHSGVTLCKARKREYLTNEFQYNINLNNLNTCQSNIVTKQLNENILLIPGNYIEIEKSSETTAYDLSVEDYCTFCTADGVFVFDTMAIYAVHDQEALKETYEKAFVKNTITYDADGEMIATVRHEALYGAFILTKNLQPNDEEVLELGNLQGLPESFELYNEGLQKPVRIKDVNDQVFPYGLALLNKWCGFDEVLWTETITKKSSNNLSKFIYNYFNCDEEDFDVNYYYYEALTNLNKKLLFFISSTHHSPSLNIQEMLDILDDDTAELFQRLPEDNIDLGFHINEALIDRCIENCDKESSLYQLYASGSRFSKAQLARSCLCVGYSADAENITINKPVTSNLIKGLTPEQFERGAPGSRKG